VPALSLSGALGCLLTITAIVAVCSGACVGAWALRAPLMRPLHVYRLALLTCLSLPLPACLPGPSPALPPCRVPDGCYRGSERKQRHQPGIPGPHRAAHRRQRRGAHHGTALGLASPAFACCCLLPAAMFIDLHVCVAVKHAPDLKTLDTFFTYPACTASLPTMYCRVCGCQGQDGPQQ
jgi:hypothetical protein